LFKDIELVGLSFDDTPTIMNIGERNAGFFHEKCRAFLIEIQRISMRNPKPFFEVRKIV